MSKKVVTVITDSLGMVRPDEERFEDRVTLKSTYPYLLQELLGDEYYVASRSGRGRTSSDIASIQMMYDEVLYNDSDVIVIQVGICDCAPRIIGGIERMFIKLFNKANLTFLTKLYIKVKSKYRFFFTRYLPQVNVPLPLFTENMNFIVNEILENTESQIILINISDTSDINEKRSYGFRDNICAYNSKLNNLKGQRVSIVDLYTMTTVAVNSMLVADGIHLSAMGNKVLSSEIEKKIRNEIT